MNIRLRHQVLFWVNSPVWEQSTRNNSTKQCRSRTLGHHTGATELLRIKNFLQEMINMKKIYVRTHTDSSSRKNIAKRIGSTKKATHVELKHRFTASGTT